ncbi:hypothetical protein CFP56_041405 [Quercus suber]|uniref:PGG domain-containing protein n=1 Tax=Quercus suber TaxID=58331 RepID=A0AAW0IV55_QUESU
MEFRQPFTAAMMVQVWGQPFDLINEDIGKDIGGSIGRVLDTRVELPLNKQIRRGTPVFNSEGDKAKVGERPYGDWLRAGFRRIEKPKGKKHGSQIGDWEETSDQTREPPQTPRNHGEGSSNDTFANMVTITERDKSLALFTGVEVVDIFVSMENALEDYVMQTDIPKKRQQLDILGENLISMPNMFMEKDGRENIGVSSDETLAAKTNVLSCGSSRDNKNNSSTRTRKWKKKEKHEKTKSAPIHDNKGLLRQILQTAEEMPKVNLLVATLFAIVTFAAAFQLPGGYNDNG